MQPLKRICLFLLIAFTEPLQKLLLASSYLSICRHEAAELPYTFSWNLIFGRQLKFVDTSQFWLTFDHVTGSVLSEVQAGSRETVGGINIIERDWLCESVDKLQRKLTGMLTDWTCQKSCMLWTGHFVSCLFWFYPCHMNYLYGIELWVCFACFSQFHTGCINCMDWTSATTVRSVATSHTRVPRLSRGTLLCVHSLF